MNTPFTLRDIHIRDPFVLPENGIYYLYGTTGSHFGQQTGGFFCWKSTDLVHWSEPVLVFDSCKYGMNSDVNWAPEVHRYQGKYYLCATFTFQGRENRGTFILACDTPDGEFVPHSSGSITPPDWYALDGTLYFENGNAYMVFCHEHVQILDGTVEAVRLSPDLKQADGECVTLFHGSDAFGLVNPPPGRYVTDGPFLYRHRNGTLSLMWSTCMRCGYVQCRAVSDNGSLFGKWMQKPHLFDRDGGHGMLFHTFDGRLLLSLHSPNVSGKERPVFLPMREDGDILAAE